MEQLITRTDRPTTNLRNLVATHLDADHLGGLIAVLNSISICQFVNGGKAHMTKKSAQLLELVEQKNIKYVEPKIEQLLVGGWNTGFTYSHSMLTQRLHIKMMPLLY